MRSIFHGASSAHALPGIQYTAIDLCLFPWKFTDIDPPGSWNSNPSCLQTSHAKKKRLLPEILISINTFNKTQRNIYIIIIICVNVPWQCEGHCGFVFMLRRDVSIMSTNIHEIIMNFIIYYFIHILQSAKLQRFYAL